MVELKDDFERELREQLRTRPAPEGFTDRVMARVRRKQARPSWTVFRNPAWKWAVAALLVVGMVMGGLVRERQQQADGERAREQVLLALRITGSTLRDVQQKVSSGGSPEKLNQKGAGRRVLEKDEQ